MRSLIVAFVVLLVGLTQSARADVALLVHGYLGNAGSWEFSGINAVLAGNGWLPAGVILPGPGGATLPPPFNQQAAKKVYAVELPSTAPLMVQSDILIGALRAVRSRHPKESITLVGHSAGGVVARLALVRGGADGVSRLVTIASPHLGTERALEALDATQDGGPVGFFKDVVGGSGYRAVKHSWPVLIDLSPAVPGSTLFWLNGQPHPRIQYVSIMRAAPFGLGDLLVPGFSQDLNNVAALRGQAKSFVVPADHTLVAADGTMLASILR